jgi:glycerate dehydrogenase
MESERPRHRIVFLERGVFPFDLKRPRFPHEWIEYRTTRQEDVVARLNGASIAITNRLRLGRPELEKLPDLRMIAVAATGYDQIDIAACREFGVVVSNLRGWCDCSVSEHVFAFALALRRNLAEQERVVRGGIWQRSAAGSLLCAHPARDLCGDTIGIIGFGGIGKRVAGLAKAFGMKVLVAEHKGSVSVRPGRIEFQAVLHQSDIISVHCPLNAETRNLIGADELRLMKPSAILINCARGELIDNAALSDALSSGTIGGAGLDGLESEPPSAGNPLMSLDHSNLIITPHVAWASDQAIEEFRQQLADNLEAFAAGAPQNAVT